MTAVICIIGILLAYRLGIETAHITIADECEKLGGFYVGKKIYRCTAIKPAESEGEGV